MVKASTSPKFPQIWFQLQLKGADYDGNKFKKSNRNKAKINRICLHIRKAEEQRNLGLRWATLEITQTHMLLALYSLWPNPCGFLTGYSLWSWQLAVPCYIQSLCLKFMNLWCATLQEVSTSWVGQCQHPPAEPRWPHRLSSQYSDTWYAFLQWEFSIS